MPNTKIGDNVIIDKAIIGADAVVRRDCRLVMEKRLAVVGANRRI